LFYELELNQCTGRALRAGDFGVVLLLAACGNLRDMELPDLKYEYSHCVINSVKIGPRREITLSIQILEWIGQSGQLSSAKPLRFGGIVNFDEVKDFFSQNLPLDLAYLRYSNSHHSKPNNLFVELHSERTADKLIIQCSSIQIS